MAPGPILHCPSASPGAGGKKFMVPLMVQTAPPIASAAGTDATNGDTTSGNSGRTLNLKLPTLPDQPGKKVSRTRRWGLSAFRSTRTRLCQVPSAMRPPVTGMTSDGLTKTGSRWSAP